jgi:hypothetical protein
VHLARWTHITALAVSIGSLLGCKPAVLSGPAADGGRCPPGSAPTRCTGDAGTVVPRTDASGPEDAGHVGVDGGGVGIDGGRAGLDGEVDADAGAVAIDGGATPDSSGPIGEWDVTRSPPELVDPIRVEIPRDLADWGPYHVDGYACAGPMYIAEYPPDRDVLIVHTGDAPLVHPVHVNGGRNVRIVGMHITLEPACAPSGDDHHPRVAGDRALALGQSGTTFVEGAMLDVAGHDADCITANNAAGLSPEDAREQRAFVLQNSRCEGNEGSNGGTHGDLFQTQHPGHFFRLIAFENVSHRTAQEGIIIEAFDGIHHAREVDIRRFDYAFDPRFVDDDEWDLSETGGMIAVSADVVGLDQIFCEGILGGCTGEAYISTDPSIHEGGWTHPPVVPMPHPAFTDGTPPADFAPADRVGAAYRSPHGV